MLFAKVPVPLDDQAVEVKLVALEPAVILMATAVLHALTGVPATAVAGVEIVSIFVDNALTQEGLLAVKVSVTNPAVLSAALGT